MDLARSSERCRQRDKPALHYKPHPLCYWAALALLSAGLTSAAAVAHANPGQPPENSAREAFDRVDRAYGYQIGDLVDRHITLRGSALAAARQKVPEPHQINTWLSLMASRLHQTGGEHVLTLTYQITGASQQVSLLELPVVELKTGEAIAARIDALPISVSPLFGAKPFLRTGMGALQNDRPPPTPDFNAMQQRLAVLAGCFGLTALCILWRQWRARRPGHALPFMQARQTLKHLHDPEAAWQVLHRAFDQTAGCSVFLEDLPELLRANPGIEPASDAIREFFAESQQRHFAGGNTARPAHTSPDTDAIRKIQALASSLAKLEARS